MNDNINIKLSELSAYELESLREEFETHFNSQDEFYDFIEMQIKYYPLGISPEQLAENISSFAFSNAMNGLINKLGAGVIKEHQTDSGDLFYSLGDIKYEG